MDKCYQNISIQVSNTFDWYIIEKTFFSEKLYSTTNINRKAKLILWIIKFE